MIKTGKELAQKAKELAENYKSVYAMGCFGWPMNKANQNRAIEAYAYNRRPDRMRKIRESGGDTFAFDCVCMIKALLWGWCGDQEQSYGGAAYASNGVPDKNADQMIALCNGVSRDFSNIRIGEVVWMSGHIGIYIGNGLAVECTPKWSDGVQITAVHNIGRVDGYNGRTWISHGRLPYISYENAFSLDMVMLRRGMEGSHVRALQVLLEHYGFHCGIWGADGDFGEATETALMAYQRANHLEADGIAGPLTMACLLGVSAND